MPQAPVPTYRVEYEPSRGSWLLSGPVGAKGCLRYTTARDAANPQPEEECQDRAKANRLSKTLERRWAS
ncbi:MAG: hypothetical protein L7W40_11530 [Akkermansiaceae bacterium]|nr:hypothetical protein [Akkermansiaceae bacterium]